MKEFRNICHLAHMPDVFFPHSTFLGRVGGREVTDVLQGIYRN